MQLDRDEWGKGYTTENIDSLNKMFDNYSKDFQIRTQRTKSDIIAICKMELKLNELMERERTEKEDLTSEIQKTSKIIQELSSNAKLSESKRTADDYGMDALSKFVANAEKGLLANGVYINPKAIVVNELKIKKDEYDLILDNYNLNVWNGGE